MRDGESLIYSRGGSFVRGPDGTIADERGRVLQQAGGGDLVAAGEQVEIVSDGTVLANGMPVAAVGIFETSAPGAVEALGGSLYGVPLDAIIEAEVSSLRQGYLESANVVLSDELVAMMTASRQAESGARISQVYDQLIGQAITTFGRGTQ
ncbi:flagellar basal body rod C-terminal domain-containing protein [Pelagerythrobacter marensis]|nr:flagellar basal body rod C-terminal domain-containing protein [Pelagerythrobacter marensis]